jgi:alpha-galactosidase
VVQAQDDSSKGEQWRLLANRTGAMTLVNTASGKVLTAPSGPPGTGLDQSTATGADNQRWRVTPNADGSAYVLTNVATTMTADVHARTAGSPVVQLPEDRQPSQQWQIVQVPDIQAGTYHMTNSNSGLDLDVSGGSTADGALIVQEPDQGNADTQWTFTPVGGGYWTITNKNSGLLLADPGASTSQGVQLQQHTADGSAAEQWRLYPNADGTYTLINRTSGMDVDVSGQSTAPGGIVIQWPDNGGANQHWVLTAA